MKIPYSVRELFLASEQPPDPYHRDLMLWAAKRIEELEYRLGGLSTDSYPYTLERDMPAGTTIQLRIPKEFMVR